MVIGKSSPDDPELKEYWAERNKAKTKELLPSYQKIAKKQSGVCPVCNQSLLNEEILHCHHIIPRSQGGKNTYANLQLVHLYCHQQIHAQEKAIMPEQEQPLL